MFIEKMTETKLLQKKFIYMIKLVFLYSSIAECLSQIKQTARDVGVAEMNIGNVWMKANLQKSV